MASASVAGPSTPGTAATAMVDTAAGAIQSCAEATRKEFAALFASLEAREERVAEFSRQRDAAAEEISSQVAAARVALDRLLPDASMENGGPVVAAERERMRERVAQRAAAQKEEQSSMADLKELHHAMSEARLRLNTFVKLEKRDQTSMRDWFYAPASRARSTISPVKLRMEQQQQQQQ